MGMKLVEVDERFRVTIPKEVRRSFKVVKGQRFYLVPYGNDLLMKPFPVDADSRLDKVIGKFKLDERTRRTAEKWLLQAGKRS